MGQGMYQAIVFGVINPPTEAVDDNGFFERAEWYAAAEDAASERHGAHFDSGSNDGPFYRGVTIAANDGILAQEWGVPSFAYTVIPSDDLLDWINEYAAETYADAIAAWEDIRAAGREAGIEVPEGKLLLVSDWD